MLHALDLPLDFMVRVAYDHKPLDLHTIYAHVLSHLYVYVGKVSDSLTGVQWLQDRGCYRMLFDTNRYDPSHEDVQWLLYLQDPGCKIVFLSSYLIQIA